MVVSGESDLGPKSEVPGYEPLNTRSLEENPYMRRARK